MTDFSSFLKEEHGIDSNEAKKKLSSLLVSTPRTTDETEMILFAYDQLQRMEEALKKSYEDFDQQRHSTRYHKAQNERLRRKLTKVGNEIRKEVGKKTPQRRTSGTSGVIKWRHRRIILPHEVK